MEVTPIPKGLRRDRVKSYRGLTLMDHDTTDEVEDGGRGERVAPRYAGFRRKRVDRRRKKVVHLIR